MEEKEKKKPAQRQSFLNTVGRIALGGYAVFIGVRNYLGNGNKNIEPGTSMIVVHFVNIVFIGLGLYLIVKNIIVLVKKQYITKEEIEEEKRKVQEEREKLQEYQATKISSRARLPEGLEIPEDEQ